MSIFTTLRNIDWKSINILDIIGGCADEYLTDWVFYKSKEKKEFMKRVSIGRLKKCSVCHMNNNGTCNNSGKVLIENVDTGKMMKGCGCNIRCKSMVMSHECPAGLWKAVKIP